MGKTYFVTMVQDCEHCQGTGYIRNPHCTKCERPVPDTPEFWEKMGDLVTLPCGHSAHGLIEDSWCVECEGEGKIVRQVSLTDALRDLGNE